VSTPATPPPEEPGSEPAPPPEARRARRRARRRRAWRRVALASPLFLLVGLVLAIVELPYILPAELVRDEVVRAVTEATGADLEIRKLTYDPLTGLELEGVRLGPPEGFTEDVFTADRLRVRYSLAGALSRRVTVEAVKLDAPSFTLETRGGRTNVDALLEAVNRRYPPGPPEPPGPPREGPLIPVDVVLDELAVGPLSLRLVGEGPTGHVSQVWLHLDGVAGRRRLELAARLTP